MALTLKSKSTCACCDRCHIETHHTRGWQKRKVTMPPLGGKRFTLILYMRKFHCKADGHFFTEQQPDWLNKYARFSIDCTRLMNQVHLQMSSVSASRIVCQELSIGERAKMVWLSTNWATTFTAVDTEISR